ncbi:MAG TPA: metalloprotease PmbA [Steroidobacteraceae bacterium]|jgi:PmbA protein|nr:metalloprotease PmbA [Steroidobacteraceae bacterium]
MSQQVDASRISELEAVVAAALEQARASGASHAEADASLQRGLTVSVRLGEVETIEYHRDRGLSLTVYFGHAKGSASTADLRPAAVREIARKAAAIARHTASDEYAGLADPENLAREPQDLDLYHPWDLAPEQAVTLARECEAAGLASDARLTNSEGATVTTHSGVRVYGNSHGFLQGVPSTSHSVSCALVAQADDDMQRDYWYSVARRAQALEEAAVIGRRAAQRALRRLGARKLPTQRAPVLFAPELARGLFGHFVGAIRGPSQYRRTSFLLEAAGSQIFPSFLRIAERPHLPQGLASSAFDAEGVATRDRELVQGGVLQGYVLGSYSARKLGLVTTGNAGGIHNLLVTADDAAGDHSGSFDELVQRMGDGLYVTELMGPGVNGVTGDYSRGASGFWVERGELSFPVHEVTIAGNLREMLRGIVAVGTDVDSQGAIRTGSMLLDAMTIAGE